jgi:DNA-binding PadR family transcriptional regulator
MVRRPRSNPLALAILTVLQERPRHPYDVAATLRTRHTQDSVKLNFGTLYNVVDGLVGDGFIEATETVREGRRPERTIYRITEAGVRELHEWLTDLVSVPVKEYLQFEAALALLGALPPEEAAEGLRRRLEALDVRIAQMRASEHAAIHTLGLPRLFLIEGEYTRHLAEAEREFVQRLLGEIEDGTLEGVEFWRSHHGEGECSFPVSLPHPPEPVAHHHRHEPDPRPLPPEPVTG